MKIVYIHGANATKMSFDYIRGHLKKYDYIDLEYNANLGFEHNLAKMKRLLDSNNLFFVCHSMGGLYAVHLAHHFKKQTIGAVTLSTPYGGIELAKYFFPFSYLIQDINPHNTTIQQTNALPITHPWYNIVTVQGHNPWIPLKNDGVVTIASQTHRTDMHFEHVDLNHHEVLRRFY